MYLTGSPADTRADSAIDFNWGAGAPGVTGVGTDNFSVRWDGSLKVATTGNYQFETVSDDGVRLYVNNVLVIDNWTNHSATSNTTSNIALTAGTSYPVRVEYFEGGGDAVIQLHWKKPSDSSYSTINSCPSALAGYTVSSSGVGITCAGEPITFTAVDSTGAAIMPASGTNVTLSTVAATGTWIGGNTYSFNGSVSSFIKYLQQTTPAALTMNITDGRSTGSGAINFVNSALKFYSDATGSAASATMLNQIAGTATGVGNNTPVLKAIRTDTTTGTCVAQTTGTRVVNLGYVCRNPTTCISGQSFTINNTNIQANANANLASPSYLPVSLNFDNTGTASIPLVYSDVGQVRLSAQLNLAASGNDPAISLSGSSTDFVVKPYTLAVVPASIISGTVSNPAGTTGTFATSAFIPGGTPFQVNVEARNSVGQRTPNFGNESTYNAELNQNNIGLSNLTLVYPTLAAGGIATALNGSVGFTSTTPAGTFTNANVIWDQVGSFTVQPRLGDNDYLGAGDITPTTSVTIGRFYPDHFTLKPTSLVINSCATSPALIYMGQPAASWTYTLEAQGFTGTVMKNYGIYGSPAAKPYGVAENANNGTNVISRLSATKAAIDTGVWTSGIWAPTTPGATFDRAATPDAPYSSLQLGLGVKDTFDLRSLSVKDMDATTTSVCSGASCTEIALGSPWDVRYGRLRLDDAFGPETFPLNVNFITEYWVGNHFSLNTSDSCTLVPRSAITYPAGNIAADANRTVSLTGGSTQGTYANLTATDVKFNAGTAGQIFTSPAGGKGRFVVGVNLTTLPWLRFDWNQDGDYSDLLLPNANFEFGSYRGNDRIIYWREKLQ
jgi:MSHA biogenesis protein MshQ